MKLMVNPDLSIRPFHGDSPVPLTVCEVPDNSGRPRRYLVPRQLSDLLPVCDGGLDREEAVTRMSEKAEGRYTAQQLEQLIDEFLIPRHLLMDPNADSKPIIAAPRLDRYLFFKVRFLKQAAVYPLANRLRWLFEPAAWKCLIPLIVLSHVWFYLALGPHRITQVNELSNSSIPLVLLLFSFGGMLHEFGHAAALTRFGGKTAEIGFGIYICFAALFVDLSEAWRLTGKQRVVIDLSGIYFQGILLIFMAAGYAWSGWPVLACCFIFIDLEIAANLNPLLRLDGYWALADGLGIPNLRTRSVRYFLLPRIRRGRPTPILNVSPRMLRLMHAYLVMTMIFSVFIAYAIGAQFTAVIQDYPRLLHSALESWQAASPWRAVSLTFAAIWRGMLLLGLATAIFRAVLWVSQNIRPNSSSVLNTKELPVQ